MKKTPVRLKDPVLVNWVDSFTHEQGWVDAAEYRNIGTLPIQTIGFLVAKSSTQVVLSPTKEVEGRERVSSVWVIPRGCIQSIKRIRL